MGRDLQKLARLAAMIKDAELARLAALADERRSTEAALDRLRTERKDALRQTGLDPASLAGALPRWMAWCDRRQAALFTEAAAAAARTEAQTFRTRQAFGRSDVLNKLARKNGAP